MKKYTKSDMAVLVNAEGRPISRVPRVWAKQGLLPPDHYLKGQEPKVPEEVPEEEVEEEEVPEEEVEEEENLEDLTNAQLRERLKERGLDTSGNKDELIARLS